MGDFSLTRDCFLRLILSIYYIDCLACMVLLLHLVYFLKTTRQNRWQSFSFLIFDIPQTFAFAIPKIFSKWSISIISRFSPFNGFFSAIAGYNSV